MTSDMVLYVEQHRYSDPDMWNASWKVWMLRPRFLLSRPSKGEGGRRQLCLERYDMFMNGHWEALCNKVHNRGRHYIAIWRNSSEGTISHQTLQKVESLVRMGQLHKASQILTSLGVADGTRDALRKLRKGRAQRRHGLSEETLGFIPMQPVCLDQKLCAKKGLSVGLSGLRKEHLCAVCDCQETLDIMSRFASSVEKGLLRESSVEALRLARLNKARPGKIRPIAAGDTFRGLVATTLAAQHSAIFRDATAPHGFGVAVSSSIECVSHLIRCVIDEDPDAVILSIDGIKY